MADQNKMMFVRPRACHDCGHGFFALQHVLQYAQQRGFNTIDLAGEQANKGPIYEAIDQQDPGSFYGFGHGNICVFTSEAEEPVFTCEECDRLSGRVVYLLSCVPPDTLIECNPDIKQIQDIKIGDRVFTHKGRYKKVTQLFKRKTEGDIFEIKTHNLALPIKITPEHPIYATKLEKCKLSGRINTHYCRPRINKRCKMGICKTDKKWQRYAPEWLEAKELTKEYALVYPINRVIKNVENIKISDYVKSREVTVKSSVTEKILSEIQGKELTYSEIGELCLDNNRTFDLACHIKKRMKSPKPSTFKVEKGHIIQAKDRKKIRDDIAIDEKFMELSGFYLSEGTYNEQSRQITFGFHIDENEYHSRVKYLMKKIFDLDCHEYVRENCKALRFYSTIIGNFFKELFGIYSEKKRMPDFFTYLPLDKQSKLIDTLFAGDGYDTKTGKGYNTTSSTLACQVKNILLRLGHLPYFQWNKNAKSKIGIYDIWIKKSENPSYGWIDGGYAYLPLREINRMPYDGFVYNLEVENDNSYSLPSSCVHNCLTANGLGPEIIRQGAIAYAGFNISWTWMSATGTEGDPYEDIYALCFWESANELWMTLVDGATFEEAVKASVAKYNAWIDYWFYDNPEDPLSQEAIKWLIHDRNGLVSLNICDVLTDEAKCMELGCQWYTNKCYSQLPQKMAINWALAIPIIIVVGLTFIAVKK